MTSAEPVDGAVYVMYSASSVVTAKNEDGRTKLYPDRDSCFETWDELIEKYTGE